MFQDKIKREKPPYHDAPVSLSPVADVLDSEHPVNRLARYPARPASAIKHRTLDLASRPPINQSLDESVSSFSPRIEVMTELSAGENSTVETDKRDPFRFPPGPSKGRKRPLPALQVLDHRPPVTTARSPCR